MLVGWRRLAGALSSPLQPSALLAVGVLLTLAAIGIRSAWYYLPAEAKTRGLDWSIALLPTAAVLALGAALSLPGTAPGGVAAFWALLVTEELWAWRSAVRRRLRPASPGARAVRLAPPQKALLARRSSTESPPTIPGSPPTIPEWSTIPADEVLQQLTRSQAADGSGQVAGWLRMPFAAGQRTASVHVAFCPPFPKTPELAVEQLDGPPTRIKTAQLLPYGMRLDLKLNWTAEEPLVVLLEFSARGGGLEIRDWGLESSSNP